MASKTLVSVSSSYSTHPDDQMSLFWLYLAQVIHAYERRKCQCVSHYNSSKLYIVRQNVSYSYYKCTILLFGVLIRDLLMASLNAMGAATFERFGPPPRPLHLDMLYHASIVIVFVIANWNSPHSTSPVACH